MEDSLMHDPRFRSLASSWWRYGRLMMTSLVLVALMVACGGESDDDDDDDDAASTETVPLYEGAETLGSRDWTDEETDAFAAQVANGGGSIAVTDASLEEVTAYYSEGIEEDGWTSEGSLEIDDDSAIATMSNDDQVAAAYIVRGAVANDGALDEDISGIEIDQSQIDDDDTVIVFSYFRCEEDDLQVCIAALAMGS